MAERATEEEPGEDGRWKRGREGRGWRKIGTKCLPKGGAGFLDLSAAGRPPSFCSETRLGCVQAEGDSPREKKGVKKEGTAINLSPNNPSFSPPLFFSEVVSWDHGRSKEEEEPNHSRQGKEEEARRMRRTSKDVPVSTFGMIPHPS